MRSTSNTNNVGIGHLARKTGGQPACNNRRAMVSLSREQFECTTTYRQCQRCLVILQKWKAAAKRAQGE